MTEKKIEINYEAAICGIKGHYPNHRRSQNELEMRIGEFGDCVLEILDSTDSKGKGSYAYLSGDMIGTEGVSVTVEQVLYKGPTRIGHDTSHALSFRKYVKLGRPEAFKVKTILSSD